MEVGGVALGVVLELGTPLYGWFPFVSLYSFKQKGPTHFVLIWLCLVCWLGVGRCCNVAMLQGAQFVHSKRQL